MDQNAQEINRYQLFYYSSCPFCMFVRMELEKFGLTIPLKNIMRHPEYREELIAGGGKSQVPCLRIEHENGNIQWMYESRDIVSRLKSESARF